MKKNYLYGLKEKFRLKKISDKQPTGVWIFVITLNFIAFVGYFALNLKGINLTQ